MTTLGQKLIKSAKEGCKMIMSELLDVRAQSKKSIRDELAFMERRINLVLDVLIPLRQNAPNGDKQMLSYITKKMEVALGAIHRAQDKIDE